MIETTPTCRTMPSAIGCGHPTPTPRNQVRTSGRSCRSCRRAPQYRLTCVCSVPWTRRSLLRRSSPPPRSSGRSPAHRLADRVLSRPNCSMLMHNTHHTGRLMSLLCFAQILRLIAGSNASCCLSPFASSAPLSRSPHTCIATRVSRTLFLQVPLPLAFFAPVAPQ